MIDFIKQMARILGYIQPNADGVLELNMIARIQDPEGNYLLWATNDTTAV